MFKHLIDSSKAAIVAGLKKVGKNTVAAVATIGAVAFAASNSLAAGELTVSLPTGFDAADIAGALFTASTSKMLAVGGVSVVLALGIAVFRKFKSAPNKL